MLLSFCRSRSTQKEKSFTQSRTVQEVSVCEGQIEVLLLGGSSMEGSQTLSAALWRVYQFDGERVLMRGKDQTHFSWNLIFTQVGNKTFSPLLTYVSTCVVDRVSLQAGTGVPIEDSCLLNGSRVLGGTGGGAGPGGGLTSVGGGGAGRTGTSLDLLGWSLSFKQGPAPFGTMYPSRVPN